MNVREAADQLGCTIGHVRHLCQAGRLRYKVRLVGARATYNIDASSLYLYELSKSATGFPRGCKRDGPRGLKVKEG